MAAMFLIHFFFYRNYLTNGTTESEDSTVMAECRLKLRSSQNRRNIHRCQLDRGLSGPQNLSVCKKSLPLPGM